MKIALVKSFTDEYFGRCQSRALLFINEIGPEKVLSVTTNESSSHWVTTSVWYWQEEGEAP